MLEFKNIEINIANRSLFKLTELDLSSGLIALVGRNGSGKSTFLRTILGEHQNYSGEISLNNQLLKKNSRAETAKLISVVYSKPEIFGNHTVFEVLLIGRLPHQGLFAKASEEDIRMINSIVRLLELAEYVDRPFNNLSDGEKQLVMIGRALAQDTKVVVLDEPGAFLDLVNRYKLTAILKKIATESDKLIIYSTHHIDLLEDYCSGILLISDQQMKYLTDSKQFLAKIKETFSLE